jgi:DoxX-like family
MMPTAPETTVTFRGMVWTGRILSGLVVLFMLFDSVIKILKMPFAVDATVQLGYSAKVVVPIGIIELICTLLYATPRTSLLGAVLLTGHLGGAIATHLRHGDPLFSHVLFPTYIGALLWVGLLLRDPRLRELFPWRR